MICVCQEEELLNAQIRKLETVTPPNERITAQLCNLRKLRTELIVRNIGRY